ncbi:Uncharacterised protein [Mycobacteroides abscessus]|nr:Uncharacterised protein [Mycobacteroides abscessus]
MLVYIRRKTYFLINYQVDNNNVSRLRERLLMNLNLSLPMSQQGH